MQSGTSWPNIAEEVSASSTRKPNTTYWHVVFWQEYQQWFADSSAIVACNSACNGALQSAESTLRRSYLVDLQDSIVFVVPLDTALSDDNIRACNWATKCLSSHHL